MVNSARVGLLATTNRDDGLTSASQVNGAIVYDAHGNITQLGDTSFTYDSLDRHVSTVLPTGQVVSLERDIDGSVLTRTMTAPNQPVEVVKYSVGVVQFYLNSANQVTGTTQSLPGGVSVTDAKSTSTTTFTSLQGNAGLTVSALGTARTRFDPFGTPLTALPDKLPGSAEAGFGTVAGKLTDTLSAFGLIDMGARLYSTVLGRFLQVDPVPGGGVNAYAYPPDPVNMNDYSGRVATADAFVAWHNRKAGPGFDGNFASVPKMRSARQLAEDVGRAIEFAALALSAAAFIPGFGAVAIGLAMVAGVLSAAYQCKFFNRTRCTNAVGFASISVFGGIGGITKMLNKSQALFVDSGAFAIQAVDFMSYRRPEYANR